MASQQTSQRPPTQVNPQLADLYDTEFYDKIGDGSVQSARIYLKYLWDFFQPISVLDVGCGRGAWLKACHELGSETLLGFDGDWNTQSSMMDGSIEFKAIDLRKPFTIPNRVDLAMTLEVAEHLPVSMAKGFIKSLTDASDAILFSAAYTKQGGLGHVNEQPHSYWAKLFSENGFVAFDLFRPKFWENTNVCYWYRQNTFLYVKKNSKIHKQMKTHGLTELINLSFMDCIHPDLYSMYVTKSENFTSHITDLAPSFWRALKRRLI